MPRTRTFAVKSALLISVGGAALAMSTPALAITATTPTNFSVQQIGTNCFIDFNSTITGVDDDDGNGRDNYIIRTRFGSAFGPGSFPSIPVGTTQSSFQTVFFQNPNSSGGTVEVVIFERGATTALGAELASAQVPVALLNAAGGTCAQGVQNFRPTTDAGPAQAVAGGTTITLQGSANDPEGDPLTFRWTQLSGPSVTLSNDTILNPTFTAPARAVDDQILRFNLRATETNRGRSISDNVDITVLGNEAPVAVAGAAQTVAGRTNVTLDASASTDAERDALTYSWRQIRGPSITLANRNTATPSFTAPNLIGNNQNLQFEVTVTDTFGEFTRATQAVTVLGNAQPIADAGPDQGTFLGGTLVTLDGSGSFDPDGTPLTYTWRQTFGVPVTLSDPNAVSPTFTTPSVIVASAALVFELQVSDGVSTRSDTVQINMTGSRAPTADAGPNQTVSGGATVTLAGTASDPDGDGVTFQWTQTSGPSVTLSDPTIAAPTFTAPATAASGQTLTFQLIATDDSQAMVSSVPDTVTITIPANQAPVADIQGPTSAIRGGYTIVLDGSASIDPDGQALTYQWTQTSGPVVTFSGQGSPQISFTAPAGVSSAQPIGFELLVTDQVGASDTASFTATVAANNAPIADAGQAQSVIGGQVAQLDGTGSSDADLDTLTYSWTQLSGPTVNLSDPTSATPTATIPEAQRSAQDIVLSLIVNDGQVDSIPAQVTLSLAANAAPSADAGTDASVDSGTVVTLDAGGSSDPEGDTLTYAWTQLSGPSVILSDASIASPSFTAPPATNADQALVFEVLVTDAIGAAPIATQRDQVTITINANRPPVADAGVDQGPIDAGQTITLDASGSNDPDGNALTYSWVQTGGPAVTLSDTTAVQPTFIAPDSNATLTFELTVNDGLVSETDTVSIEVRAVGSITIVQRITGTDTQVSFTSSLAALNTSISTNSGIAQVSAQNVPIGSYTVTAADLSSQGVAITDITCSDADSLGNISARSVQIELDAGEDVTCTFSAVNSREAAQAAIYNYLTGRNALILANQPDLQRRIDRLNENGGTPEQGALTANGFSVPGAQHLPFKATVTPGRTDVSTSLAMARGGSKTSKFDLWLEASLSRARIGDQEANFSIVHIGADLRMSDDILLGATLQFDGFEDRDSFVAGEAEGDGFLIGPYLTARLAPQLFVEARAAWGSSDNTVSAITGQLDEFETSRALYSGSIVGEVNLGKATVLRPELTLRHFSENQKAYVDALGISIPTQTVDQGDLSFRPRLSHSLKTKGGVSLRPYAQVEGIYTFGTEPDAALAGLLAGSFADQFGGVRARIEGGIDLLGKGNFRASFSGYYDGIGADGFSNEGLAIGVSFGF